MKLAWINEFRSMSERALYKFQRVILQYILKHIEMCARGWVAYLLFIYFCVVVACVWLVIFTFICHCVARVHTNTSTPSKTKVCRTSKIAMRTNWIAGWLVGWIRPFQNLWRKQQQFALAQEFSVWPMAIFCRCRWWSIYITFPFQLMRAFHTPTKHNNSNNCCHCRRRCIQHIHSFSLSEFMHFASGRIE